MKKTLADALEARGYSTLTAVQEAVTAPETIGQDLLVSAQTGSGKTIGFGLAIAPGLLDDEDVFARADAPLALVIAPTRELALQVKRELEWLFAGAGAVLASTVGGMDMRDERRALARGTHIVVATPGRLRDHIMRGSIDLSALRAVVLDEADEMLDLGFREDLEFILESAPADRQTLLFSATVPAAIAKLAKSYQKDALRITATSGASQHADIDYRALRVSARDGENAIINVLRYYEAPNAIVFCNTRAMVNRLTTRLSNRGFSVVALSGELSQSERTHALQAMRDGRARVCVATDVAARGIDLPNLELVIHAELPTNQDTLLHRSGRTGRAGRKGVSAMIVPPAARKKAERLLGWAKLRADWANAPSAEEVTAKDEERMLANPDWLEPVSESDEPTVTKISETFTPEQIAAAYLRLFRERHSAPEDLSDANEAVKPRAPFGPSVWFSLPGGRSTGAEPRRVLPMLCKMGDISRDDIGAIRIQQDASLIELREGALQGFLAAIGPDMTVEDGAKLSRLSAPPKLDRAPQRAKPGPAKDRKPRHVPRDEAPVTAPQSAPTPSPAAPKAGTTKPVEWNDAPNPKFKKPKGGPKKPHRKAANPAADAMAAGAAEPWKPRKSGAGKPKHAGSKDGAPRGPKPPAGKPSSKKNRARSDASGPSGKPTGAPGKPKGGSGKPAGAQGRPKGASSPSNRLTKPGGAPRRGKP
ncbi:DEAD/DEAH box helicase [Roseovarius sp. LXJ103]|uniref:DEAD/DEAH box helicase n=1 Tax=Roseovarius carneus TaxID=2853164 RepID=UPI000D6075AA|nr:DEAD/DEAH box helicase [Roseovarius carneus]MBZ8118504.1 DEAD/DEAH box helicase [Roseovarius carneus]PWE37279.1 ATP-dependent RNA helicase [Pelagicola sp. LXJ1103]